MADIQSFIDDSDDDADNDAVDDAEDVKDTIENSLEGETDANVIEKRRQTFVVSATLTLESINRNMKTESKTPIFDNLSSLVPFQSRTEIVDLTPRHRTALAVTEYSLQTNEADKDAMLYYCIHSNPGRTLVFANTISVVRRIAQILKQFNLQVWPLHSQQQQRQRLKHLDRFVAQSNGILVCSDVAARGLDIPSVDTVLHFNVPLSVEDYIHRAGRAGRTAAMQSTIPESQKRDHQSIMLVCGREIKLYQKIIVGLKRPSGLPKYPINERLLPLVKKRAKLAKEIAKLMDKNTRQNRKLSQIERMAEAADIEFDEINMRAMKFTSKKGRAKKPNDNENNDDYNKEKIATLKYELKVLLAEDLNRNRSKYLTKMRM